MKFSLVFPWHSNSMVKSQGGSDTNTAVVLTGMCSSLPDEAPGPQNQSSLSEVASPSSSPSATFGSSTAQALLPDPLGAVSAVFIYYFIHSFIHFYFIHFFICISFIYLFIYTLNSVALDYYEERMCGEKPA